MNSQSKKTPKKEKSLSWLHYHSYPKAICICSSARKIHRRNWEGSLTPKSCISPANKGLRVIHWLVKIAEDASLLHPCTRFLLPLWMWCCGLVFNWRNSWVCSERGVTVVWTWAAHTHTPWSTLSLCLPKARAWGFLRSPPSQTILWLSASSRCV